MLQRVGVLDLVPVRAGQTSSQAVQASIQLAQTADRLGYHRFWVAEHHNMPAVAATSPPVLLGIIGGVTRQIRLGSGGVMVPNHQSLVVAEQFSLLEAAFPGRVDLGVGRAPGSDPVTNWLVRGGQESADRFPAQLDEIGAMLSPSGGRVQFSDGDFVVRGTPHAESAPPIWLLGSSLYSAQLAARKGLPYVFAHHFFGKGTDEALGVYRENFQPSNLMNEPRTIITVNVCVATTVDEAHRLVRPHQLSMAALRTTGASAPALTVEDAETADAPLPEEKLTRMKRRWVVGEPAEAAQQLRDLAERFGVSELMVHPVAGNYMGDPAHESPGRRTTLELLAGPLGMG